MANGQVSCSECGYLGWRKSRDRTLSEAEKITRQTGGFPTAEVRSLHEGWPACFLLKVDIRQECGDNGEREVIAAIIRRQRECGSFTEWRPGFTPKEHAEMIHSERMLQLQAEQAEAQRTWQERQEAANRKWQQDREDESTKREDRRHREGLIVNGIVAILAAVLGGIIALFAAGRN